MLFNKKTALAIVTGCDVAGGVATAQSTGTKPARPGAP